MFSLFDESFLSGLLMGNMMEKGTMTIVTIISLIAAKVYYKYMIEIDNDERYELVITRIPDEKDVDDENLNIKNDNGNIEKDFSYQMLCVIRTKENEYKDGFIIDVFFANDYTTKLLQIGDPDNVMVEDLYPYIIPKYHDESFTTEYHYFTVGNRDDQFVFSYIPDQTFIGEIINKDFDELVKLEHEYVNGIYSNGVINTLNVSRYLCKQVVDMKGSITISTDKYIQLDEYINNGDPVPDDFFTTEYQEEEEPNMIHIKFEDDDKDSVSDKSITERPYARSKDHINSPCSTYSSSSSSSEESCCNGSFEKI